MPATGNYIMDKGYDAAAALTKFRAVKFSAEETVTPVTGSADVVAGIAQVDVSAAELAKGKGVAVRVMGASEMESNEAIAVGQLVACHTNGTAKVAVATNRVIGVCVEASTAIGQRIRVQLNLPGNILA
jgi:Uncharacterized conserved protein (DUF2190)